MGNRVIKRSHTSFFCLFLLICIIFCFSGRVSNGWTPDEKFTLMGTKIHVYFSPEPGKVSSELKEVNGVINISRENNDYILVVILSSYGTIQGNNSIDSNIGGQNIIINTTINSYTEKIPLKTPDNGSFTTYMVINLIWGDLESPLFNKTVDLAAEYQKHDPEFDLALIMIPGGVVILIFGISIGINLFLKKRRTQNFNLADINEKLLKVNNLPRKFLTRGGEFKELDLSILTAIPNPGDIMRLSRRKKRLQNKLEKLKPRLDELQEIEFKFDEARKPIINDELFKFISSYFIRASRRRENFPDEKEAIRTVQRLRDSLQEGKWDKLQNIDNVKLAWSICDKYVASSDIERKLKLSHDFNLEKDTKTLVDNLNNFNKMEKNTKLPPDANLVIQSKEDILVEFKAVDRLLENYKNLNKKDLRIYVKECSNLKKGVDEDLKWLKSVADIIDRSEMKRLELRLQKINELLIEELNVVD